MVTLVTKVIRKYWTSVIDIKCLSFLSFFNQTLILSADFSETRHLKFHENPFSGSRVDAKLRS